jgi:hypothetical protein
VSPAWLPDTITLAAAAAQGAYPDIRNSQLVIDGTAVIRMPELAELWTPNSNTVNYGANVAPLPKAQSTAAASVAPAASEFKAVAKDAAGNTYAVGNQTGANLFSYGPGASAAGSYSGTNAVIVKYNSAGVAQWAQSVTGGGNSSAFTGVAVSADGSVYAVGYQANNGTFDYGNGKTAKGSYTGTGGSVVSNAVIVKYDDAGVAQWARSTASGNASSQFRAVAVNGSGIYAVGGQALNGTLDFGNGQTATGSNSSTNSALIVKYDGNGTAQWAKTPTIGASSSEFYGVAVDGSGKVYAVGSQYGNGNYDYGGAGATGGVGSAYNAVIVQYDDTGTAQWAQMVKGGGNMSGFNGVAADGSGVYAAGRQYGTGTYTYSPGGASATGSFTTGNNALVVKYDSTGAALWAQSTTSAAAISWFNGVAVDGAGNVYAVGYQTKADTFNYGGARATGSHTGNNAVVVLYDSATGDALWAKSATGGGAISFFNGVAADSSGNFTAAGYQTGIGPFNYGPATATGAFAGNNAVAVWYK